MKAEADNSTDDKQITVVFRFDDYSSISSTDIEIKVIDAFQKYDACCTFGVIPYVCADDVHDTRPQDLVPLTSVKADILKNAIKAGVLEVALHGYSHQTIRKKRFTEFSELDYDDQVKKIAMGKNYLEEILGTQVTTFIPPWGSYDLNTIHALEKLEFKSISAGPLGDVKESSPLKYLPYTVSLRTCSLRQLRDKIETARLSLETQPIIIVLFHEYNFLEISKERGTFTYLEFIELLDWLTSQEDIHLKSINQTINAISNLSAQRFMNYKSYFKISSIIPPFLYKFCCLPDGIYLTSDTIDNLKDKLLAFVVLFYLTTFLISISIVFFGGSIVFLRSVTLLSICKYGGPAVLFLLSIYAFHDLSVSYKGGMIIVVLLGGCIGTWSFVLKLRKQGGFDK
jgi:peptidoglycan/xylan/chitin deacetylase (PgdA/CDA1 family)